MRNIRRLFISVVCVCLVLPLFAQQESAYETEKVAENLYCLYGEGGNMAVLVSDEGLLVIDSKYDHKAAETLEQVKAISGKAIQILILTHYHWDHCGGMRTVGKGALVIAHRNCKARLGKRPKKVDREFAAGIKTYEKEKVLKFGGETIRLLHLQPAHTSGDTVVVFETAKVIHTGDLFFHGQPPYIDVKDGADTANWIHVIEALSKKYPDYRLIPGHGRVTDMKSFLRLADYLKYLRAEVIKSIKAGKNAKQAMADITFDRFPDIEDKGTFSNKKNNILWVYQELARKK